MWCLACCWGRLVPGLLSVKAGTLERGLGYVIPLPWKVLKRNRNPSQRHKECSHSVCRLLRGPISESFQLGCPHDFSTPGSR